MARPGHSDLLISLDGVVSGRAVVSGSLPPDGRDLDLLVRSSDARRIADHLRESGFVAHGAQWVSFRRCSAEVVEIVAPELLALPPDALDELFAEAAPLHDLEHIVEPSPHHSLLILSRKLAADRWRFAPKHRARIERAVAADASAWEKARARAAPWGAEHMLGRLESLARHRRPPVVTRSRRAVRRPRRARVVAVAAPTPDVAHAHAHALRDALYRLGFNPRVAAPRTPTGLERRSAVLSAVLASASLWLPVLRDGARGRVLVYERSVLDVLAGAVARGAPPRVLRRHARVLRLLAPTPLRSYFLDHAGGDESRDADAGRYRAAAARVGAVSIADADTETVCAEVARDAWNTLLRRRHARRSWRRVATRIRGGAHGDTRPSGRRG